MKKNSGELLVELGVLTAQQLAECQQEAEKTESLLKPVLLKKNMLLKNLWGKRMQKMLRSLLSIR